MRLLSKGTLRDEEIGVHDRADRLRAQQAEADLGVEETCQELGISQPNFLRWRAKYIELGTPDVKRLRQLEEEKQKLKQLAADLSLDKMPQDVLAIEPDPAAAPDDRSESGGPLRRWHFRRAILSRPCPEAACATGRRSWPRAWRSGASTEIVEWPLVSEWLPGCRSDRSCSPTGSMAEASQVTLDFARDHATIPDDPG